MAPCVVLGAQAPTHINEIELLHSTLMLAYSHHPFSCMRRRIKSIVTIFLRVFIVYYDIKNRETSDWKHGYKGPSPDAITIIVQIHKQILGLASAHPLKYIPRLRQLTISHTDYSSVHLRTFLHIYALSFNTEVWLVIIWYRWHGSQCNFVSTS